MATEKRFWLDQGQGSFVFGYATPVEEGTTLFRAEGAESRSEEVSVTQKLLLPANPPEEDGLDDLISLSFLNVCIFTKKKKSYKKKNLFLTERRRQLFCGI